LLVFWEGKGFKEDLDSQMLEVIRLYKASYELDYGKTYIKILLRFMREITRPSD
jgi:hypothetical protein